MLNILKPETCFSSPAVLQLVSFHITVTLYNGLWEFVKLQKLFKKISQFKKKSKTCVDDHFKSDRHNVLFINVISVLCKLVSKMKKILLLPASDEQYHIVF